VLTLRKIEHTPGFTSGAQVKVSHSSVAVTRILTSVAVNNDWMLRRLFAQAARGLPLATPTATRPVEPLRGAPEPAAEYSDGPRRSEGSSVG
jgi:hypothetical protein